MMKRLPMIACLCAGVYLPETRYNNLQAALKQANVLAPTTVQMELLSGPATLPMDCAHYRRLIGDFSYLNERSAELVEGMRSPKIDIVARLLAHVRAQDQHESRLLAALDPALQKPVLTLTAMWTDGNSPLSFANVEWMSRMRIESYVRDLSGFPFSPDVQLQESADGVQLKAQLSLPELCLQDSVAILAWNESTAIFLNVPVRSYDQLPRRHRDRWGAKQ